MIVGNLEIAGSINTEGIKLGLANIRRGLEEAKDAAAASFGDMSRLGGVVNAMAGPLTKIGAMVAGTFTGLSALAPQIAPHLERMKTSFFELSTIVGEHFEPVFSMMADGFRGFVDWMGGPTPQAALGIVSSAILGMGEGLKEVYDNLSSLTSAAWDISVGMDIDVGEGVKWVVENLGPAAAAAALGFRMGGPWGAAAGAAATLAIQHGPMVGEAAGQLEEQMNFPKFEGIKEWLKKNLGIGPMGGYSESSYEEETSDTNNYRERGT